MKKINLPFKPATKPYSNNADAVYKGTAIILMLLLIFLKCNRLMGVITFLSVAGASAAGGAAIGFLFGLPRAEKYRFINKDNIDHNARDYSYSDNTNLEEISDWLTKIIVGLTLVKFNVILGWIHRSAQSIERTFAADCDGSNLNAYVFGYTMIIFYILAGGGLCYLWARTNLSLIFTKSKIAQLAIEKEELITQVQTLANPASLNDQITEGTQLASAKRNEPDSSFTALIERIYNAKPVFDKTDIQKGRWGGNAQVGDKILEVKYEPGYPVTGLYRLKLLVRSLDPAKPLTGNVAFFLHDTFPREIVYSEAQNNTAEIRIIAWQAFVAGARLEDGTELELDLNTIKGFPDGFYWKE
jgi:hypothetical protein